jgi:hypothetical protein
MQPTDVQVQRTLAALEVDLADHRDTPAAPRITRDTLDLVLADLPDGLLDGLTGVTPVRADRLAEALDRLEHGEPLSSDELADRIVGRLVCDRLR